MAHFIATMLQKEHKTTFLSQKRPFLPISFSFSFSFSFSYSLTLSIPYQYPIDTLTKKKICTMSKVCIVSGKQINCMNIHDFADLKNKFDAYGIQRPPDMVFAITRSDFAELVKFPTNLYIEGFEWDPPPAGFRFIFMGFKCITINDPKEAGL